MLVGTIRLGTLSLYALICMGSVLFAGQEMVTISEAFTNLPLLGECLTQYVFTGQTS